METGAASMGKLMSMNKGYNEGGGGRLGNGATLEWQTDIWALFGRKSRATRCFSAEESDKSILTPISIFPLGRGAQLHKSKLYHFYSNTKQV